jgi:hypothetical protein
MYFVVGAVCYLLGIASTIGFAAYVLERLPD